MARRLKLTLPLNKERLIACYDFLSACPPYCDWNLPDSEDVIFKVTRSRNEKGYHKLWYRGRKKDQHEIGISAYCCGWTNQVLWVMGHEMVHMHQEEVGMGSPHNDHNAAFKALGIECCQIHGWDPHEFNG